MKFIIKLFSIFILLFVQSICTQNKIEFSQLEGENVSTQSITYAIKEDNIGNIWIASEEGILKHNSKFYKIYNTYNGLPETLSNRVNEIFIAKNNNIWVGLEKGVCLYNKDLDKFNLIKSENNINPSLVTSIAEDARGNIWIAAFNGLWMYNSSTKKIKNIGYEKPIETLIVFKNDIYFGTPKGLLKYNIETKQIKNIPLSETINDVHFLNNIKNTIYGATKKGAVFKLKTVFDEISLDKIIHDFKFTVKDIIEGKNSSVYVATDGDGIYQLDDNNNTIRHFIQDSNNPTSISSNGVYDLELSPEGILWVATYGGGINYFNSKNLPFLKIQHQLNNDNSLSSNFTRSIAKDKNENLWFGTKNGLSIWNRKKNTWKHISQFDRKNKSSVIVLAIEADDNFMWIGTYNFGLYKINVNNFSIESFNDQNKDKNLITKIYAIKKDSNNTIWVGGIDKNLIAISPSGNIKEFPILHIKSITESNNGTILAAGRSGIYRINPKNNNFRIIEDLEPSKNSLAYSSIQSVAETSNNNLIIGTNGAGIIFYNAASKEIKKLNINSGIPSDIVQGVLLENNNSIWTSTTRGLVHVQIRKKDTIINVYDKKDGLASTEYNYGSYAMLAENLMAFGGVNGVTLFNPKNIIIQEQKPKLVFDEFKLFNKDIKPSEKPLGKHINETSSIILKSNENSIEMEFTGIQHSASSKMKYSWILEGFDENWSEPSINNFASYTNLNSGKYTFKVKAINKYNFESDVRTVQIKVSSPWWNSSSAFLIYGIIFILLIIGIVYFTTVIMNKKNADDQIEFFNNITHEIKTPLTILMSSLDNITNENSDTTKDSNKRIKTTVKRINSLFEQMLNFHRVTSQDSIFQEVSKVDVNKYLKGRINNFKPLTEERNISIEVNNNWPDQIFYYYKDVFDKIILNLLSNAIKYSFDNGKIIINLYKTSKGELRIEIADQGIGIPKDQQKFILKRYYRARNAINSQRPGTGLGLIMTKKLVEKTGGNISFESLENKGTTFTIHLKNLISEYRENTIKEKEIIPIENAIEEQTELDKFSDAKILIVEDNDELRGLLVEKLGTYFQIFEASNGVEGIEIASQHFPDIILTDLIMPEMDGMEMAKQLKENINLNHIPVFMLTVLQNSTQKLESIEAGVSEYIEKPVDIKLLLAKILNTLKFQIKLREKYVQDSDAENASLYRTQKDQDFLKDLENKILENIENNSFSVHDLSKSFGMSRTSLYMKLKNLVDLSPQDFVIHTKLKQAKNLLIKGQLSIKEVAYSSGFSNPKYFSTSFKKFYGKTPSAFIESLKNTSS
ncbi:response regulator [Polaribacter haliotis]|uniref:histidine kinase n=1 Tax=Polaribacter haliotis TaxID=1888915 RepID=A0A7L8AIW9_9FLAO|nr:two-component regulator propeller domain-containing protein [Polaribacter haliotis]QOD61961.1 response regulator [Polaribacter haliotis]